MKNEMPSDHSQISKIAGSFKGKLSSLLHLWRVPTPSIDMVSSSDDSTNIFPTNMAPVIGVNHAPTTGSTEGSSEASAVSSSISAPVLAAPKQLGYTPGPEIPPTHMSAVRRRPLSPSSPDSIIQAASELERNPSTQDSALGLFPNAQNILSPSPPISVPVSGSMPVQFGSARGRGLGTPPTHMFLATRNPLPPVLPDTIMQVPRKSEKNLSIQNSGSGLLGNPENVLINNSTIIVNNIPPAIPHMKIPLLHKPESSSLFVGRRDVLDKLRMIFIHCADSKLIPRCSCLLWGTGGIGKTQICLKFIEEMSDTGRLSHVFWVDASSLESIKMSFKGISSIPAAQASHLDDSAESALQWISDLQEEWLIVFDNANDLPDVVAKFIPPGNRGNILITSRNRSMGRLIAFKNVIEIIEMEEADAITLFLKASCLDASSEHIQTAKSIVASLGYMPLAVDQAGAYIEAGKCDINKYLGQLSSHRRTLMLDATFRGASGYDRTVYGTWDLSFREIKRRAGRQSSDRKAAKAAILILGICAFYHHSNISEDIFQSAAEESKKYVVDSKQLPYAVNSLDRTLLVLDNNGHWDDFTYRQGIGVLLSFSLIRRDQSSKMLSVHPLIHCWSRERMSKTEQQRMYEMGSIILSCAISERLTSYDYGLRRLIFSHIKAIELHGSQMGLSNKYYDDKWKNFIIVMREIRDWKHAEHLGVQMLDMRKKLLGEEHPSTLKSMTNLARTYYHQGKLNEAEQLGVQVLDIRKRLFGAEHPSTLTSMENLGRTYCDQGKLNKAEQLEVQVLNMRKKLLGVEHPSTLTSMENLGRTYCNQRKLNEAEQLGVQVLDIRKKLLGAEHPLTLTSMAKLAKTYYHQGKLNKAEQLGDQVLDMRKKMLGTEHPSTLTSMTKLAKTYYHQGKLNEAEQLGVQVLDIQEKWLGAEHLSTLTSMANLVKTYYDQGKLNEAEQLGDQVLDMRKKLLGAEHPSTLISMAILAKTYCDQGKLNESEQLEVQILEIRKKLFGIEHPSTLTSMANLARNYCDQGKLYEAEQLEVQVLDMRKKLLGVEHLNTLRSMENLASTYYHQRKLNEAEQLGAQVLDMRKNLLGAEHPDTLISMGKLAKTYYHQGKLNKAEQLGVQALNIEKKLLGAKHPTTLSSMTNLASTYYDQGKWDKAEQLEVQVLDIRKKLLGVEHVDTLKSMANLAITYYHQRKLNEAEQLGVQVLDIRKKLLGSEHPDTLRSIGNLAGIYYYQGKLNEAEQLECQVLDIRKKLLGAEHLNTHKSKGILVK